MERATFGNRPATLPPLTKIEDFTCDEQCIRVSLKLLQSDSDKLVLDAQAFEVDTSGTYLAGPDGRPSRTRGTQHVILASSLGDTHTLNPGWVRIVGDYDQSTFEPTAPRGTGKPSAEPDWEANPTGQYYDTATGIGYRWDEGETLRIARSKVDELCGVIRNSAPLAGIEF